MAKHGLSDRQLELIKDILRPYGQAIEHVALFGSRASGTHKNYSDVDLVLYGDIEEAIADRLWTRFWESHIPYKVDVHIYQSITSPRLKHRIDEHGTTLFTKEELGKSSPQIKH